MGLLDKMKDLVGIEEVDDDEITEEEIQAAADKLERKSVTIGCQEGENVCYGAWANGNDRISFGVGADDDQTCTDCCRVCVGGTTETVDIGG